MAGIVRASKVILTRALEAIGDGSAITFDRNRKPYKCRKEKPLNTSLNVSNALYERIVAEYDPLNFKTENEVGLNIIEAIIGYYFQLRK